jgi:pilus assembly protein Flp/PilA
MNQKMRYLCSRLRRVLTNDRGQDLVEYALVIAMICFGASSSMRPLAAMISVAMTSISANLAAS